MREQIETDTRKAIAEHVRIAVKQLRWAAQNLAAVYELVRTDDNPPLDSDDPMQLKLFPTDKNENQ